MLRLVANAATESHEWVSGPDTPKVHADVCSWCYHQTLRTGPVPPLATAGCSSVDGFWHACKWRKTHPPCDGVGWLASRNLTPVSQYKMNLFFLFLYYGGDGVERGVDMRRLGGESNGVA